MFILALISIVGTAPVPAVFLFLHGLQEKPTNDIRPTPLDDLSFLLANHLVQLFLG